MSVVSGKQNQNDHVDEDEMGRRRRLLLEQFMESFGPDRRCVSVVRKVRSHPCVVYTIKLSVKKACVSWSHRNSRRFIPNGRVPTFATVLCRAVEHDGQIEQVVHRSGGPGEPDRPGILTAFKQADYYIHESRRERGAVEAAEGSSAPRRKEVAVIRGVDGGCGITVTSHVEHLVVRLHDLLFRLAAPAVAVEIRFSERWFCLPKGWKEEGVFAEDGLHFVDIAAPLENLARKLYDMRKQEDQEMERRQSETEEEKQRRLQEEEVMRKREEEVMCKREEEWRKMCQRKQEERRRELAVARKTPSYPPGWDVVLGKIGMSHPAGVSMFNLSMNNKNQVLCKRIKEEEGFQYMLWRVLNRDRVFPISKTTPPSASASGSLEVLGYVESYCLIGYYGFVPWSGRFMDESGRMLSPVMMLSQTTKKVLTIIFFVDKFNILLDDGLTISGSFHSSVDIHCDDISCSELLTADWRHHFLCQNIDGEVTIPFSTLLVQLKKKLQLQLTDEELDLYASSVIHAEVENEKFLVPHHQQSELFPTKPKHELPEVALNDYNLLFPNPW